MNEKWIYKIDDLKLDNEALLVNETIFHNANGYIGIRSNFEEGYPEGYDTTRGSYINGFYDIAEMKQAEKLYGMAEEADPRKVQKGIARGITSTGALLVDTDEGTKEIVSGEVSVRGVYGYV